MKNLLNKKIGRVTVATSLKAVGIVLLSALITIPLAF